MENNLTLSAEKFGQLKISIGNSEVIISDWKKIVDIHAFLYEFIEYTEHWNQYLYYYSNYNEDVINELLKKQEKFKRGSYSIGDNFKVFLSLLESKPFTNTDAATYISQEYAKETGKANTLIFKPADNFCHVHTSDRGEAERFLLWSYNKIIKPALDIVKE